MTKRPKVSIVSTTYNQEKYIEAALESFTKQNTNFPIEVIIADDASSDKTPKIIQQYAEKYPDVFKPIFRKKNLGVAPNFLDVLKHANGEYIAVCEGDDYWTDPNKLQLQADFLDEHPDYSLCFHPVAVIFEKDEKKESVWPNLPDKPDLSVKSLLNENFVPTNAVMFRRRTYDNVATNVMPFDWYLHLYHAQFGKIGFIRRVMSVYRRHAAGVWWDSETDKDLLWKKYGLPNTAMYLEMLKIYGDKPELRDVIYASLSRTVSELAGVEEKYKEGLLKELIETYPQVPEIFMISNYHLQQQHDQELIDKQAEITKLNQDILDLRANIFELRNELHGLKNARLLGKIIKARSAIGDARGDIKHLPHKTRVVVAPFVPAKARRVVKQQYKNARAVLRADYRERYLTSEFIANQPWDKNAPLVSVVTAYYNAGQTIDATLDSLKKQTFKNFEVIIVNDGSTDQQSIEKLKQLEHDELTIRVINQSNQGPAVARNNGIQQARGKYIISLDADDMLKPTFIEKATMLLETNPDTALVTTHKDMFGVVNEEYKNHEYKPIELFTNNMVICAAEFRKEAWMATGGYKPTIGYEDWEYWVNLSEHGFWGKLIPEVLFKYRTSLNSRYIEDQDIHWNNIKNIRALHPNYKKNVKKLQSEKTVKHVVEPDTAFVNMAEPKDFVQTDNGLKNILITIPWMTFGGAETLIYNYCREIKAKVNITFATGLSSEHEWEYKFKEITPNIYHMANLFDDKNIQLEFICNYIHTRNIDTLHIIHNGFTFEMLPEIRRRFPSLKIMVTMFNDRVEYFKQSVEFQKYIDVFTTDNNKVANHYKQLLGHEANVVVLPNGIDCYHEFSPELFDRNIQRQELGIQESDLAVFFVGRLSEEKNPDVFLKTAGQLAATHPHLKFFVIGDGPMRLRVEKDVARINSPAVRYLGYQAEVARFLSTADIFVLPSSIEGFPLSILEAMAMRVAVIASDVGAVGEVIESGKDGFVVRPGSASEIAEAIEKLAADKDLLEQVKKQARQKVEKQYSNRILGKNYRQLYGDASA